MFIFDSVLAYFTRRRKSPPTRSKPKQPRMVCALCGRTVAYSSRTHRTAPHLCGESVKQQAIP
jgi:hypothetical protein